MKIDETYFKGEETYDSTEVITPEDSRPDDYSKVFTVVVDSAIDEPDINEINKKCSALISALKGVMSNSPVVFSNRSSARGIK